MSNPVKGTFEPLPVLDIDRRLFPYMSLSPLSSECHSPSEECMARYTVEPELYFDDSVVIDDYATDDSGD